MSGAEREPLVADGRRPVGSNRFEQGCVGCHTYVHRYEGRAYLHDAAHPPAKPRMKTKKGHFWVVRCQPCAQLFAEKQSYAYASGAVPDPWWAA